MVFETFAYVLRQVHVEKILRCLQTFIKISVKTVAFVTIFPKTVKVKFSFLRVEIPAAVRTGRDV